MKRDTQAAHATIDAARLARLSYRAPRSWTQRGYKKLTYFNEVGKGSHFAAWEPPQLFAEGMRAAFRPLRQQQ